MRVPDVQDRLRELASQHGLPELDALASELSRRTPATRASQRSATMTPELRDAIRRYRRTHPDLTQAEIAARFHVNPGRVSEALSGKRT